MGISLKGDFELAVRRFHQGLDRGHLGLLCGHVFMLVLSKRCAMSGCHCQAHACSTQVARVLGTKRYSTMDVSFDSMQVLLLVVLALVPEELAMLAVLLVFNKNQIWPSEQTDN